MGDVTAPQSRHYVHRGLSTSRARRHTQTEAIHCSCSSVCASGHNRHTAGMKSMKITHKLMFKQSAAESSVWIETAWS